MEQATIAFIIVGLAVGYIIRTAYKKYQMSKSSTFDCGCSACGESADRSDSIIT